MQVKQAIQSSANVIRVTSVSAGDVYKRFDDSYDDRVYYGVVQSVHNDGETAIIEALDLVINDTHINVLEIDNSHYLSLTDMVKDYGGSPIIERWLSSKDTIEFLGIWEQLNNPGFNSPEFEGIKNEAGI